MPDPFKTNSIGVESIQFNKENHRAIEKWLNILRLRTSGTGDGLVTEFFFKGGSVTLWSGDWLVKFEGKFYVIQNDVFDLLLRPAPEHGLKLLTTYDAG